MTRRRGMILTKIVLLMYTQKAETVEPFSSHVIPVKTTEGILWENMS